MSSTKSDGRAGLQQQMPDGLSLEDELFGDDVGADATTPPAFGRVFRVTDSRFEKSSTNRVVRLLRPAKDEEPWQSSLLHRIGQVLGRSFDHVAPLHEAGHLADGTLYLLTDYYTARLDQWIRQDSGVAPDAVRRIAGQLLEGLAALHRVGLAHGDLRPSNVFLDNREPKGTHTQAWIGDLAIGGLTHWSNGASRDAEAARYRSPTHANTTGEPDKKSDLFSLGIMLAELLLGRSNNPLRVAGLEHGSLIADVQKRLQEGRVPGDLRGLILALLDEGPKAPVDANDALDRWAELQRNQHRKPLLLALIGCVGAVLLLTSVLVYVWASRITLRDSLAKKQEELVKQQAETKDAALERDKLRASLDAEREQLTPAMRTTETPHAGIEQPENEQRKRAPIPLASPDSRALVWWRDKLSGTGRPDDFAGELDAIGKAIHKLAPEEEIKAHLQQWFRALHAQQAQAGKWLQHDASLQRRYRKVRNNPSDDLAQSELADYVSALNQAKAVWSGWMKNPAATYEQLLIEAEAADSPVARDILKRWLGGFASPHTYTLQLVKAEAKSGLGTSRRLLVYSADQEYAFGDDDGVHAWQSETEHTYNAKDEIDFQWQPGGVIRIWLGGDWSVWRGGGRVSLVDQTFSGPLAVWLLSRAGEVRQDEVRLQLKLKDCPGPPREMFVDLTQSPLPSKKAGK